MRAITEIRFAFARDYITHPEIVGLLGVLRVT